MSDDDQQTLDRLNAAVAEFANATSNLGPVLVDVALVVWEQVSYDEDGDVQRNIQYAIPADNFSLSSGLGLLEASREYVRRDILGTRGDEE